jgi:hypothetical protein
VRMSESVVFLVFLFNTKRIENIFCMVVRLTKTKDRDAEPNHISFFNFIVSSARSGTHAPTQTFHKMQCVTDMAVPSTYMDLVLTWSVLPLVEPIKQARAPMNLQRFGCLDSLTEQQLALCILRSINEDMQVDKVSLRQVLYDAFSCLCHRLFFLFAFGWSIPGMGGGTFLSLLQPQNKRGSLCMSIRTCTKL